ncbi:MAG: Rid family detoxifying hydrolase [Sphaerochaetaceae bacterium]|jgi:2-iminobutanoate/2-iminopropanoate deaminase|nr:Rid family detoxifying hydrolase [Sphaerochaetaceae bacterium]NLO61659.1 RidA family protein [Spirochaetales bacterium]MDD2405614.1 Rid family detoxifying hydrolase [Sphaerochaetaceae bacterium]MDD3670639.1 Rid family detoxifying hydrolase [Sphaerochaetaceae bacterium]MDD4259986.1 Rid family detoxifying hydrolase [Sphaerochaetaceae bacterium]
MHTREIITTDNAPAPIGAYSQGIIANGFVFVSGQGPLDPKTQVLPSDITEQTRQCIRNIEQILKAAGSSLDHIVNTHVYLADIADFSAMNEVYRSMMSTPYPTRTTVAAQLKGILVEIDVIAMAD